MFVSLSKWTHECYYGWQTPNQATNHFSQHRMYMVPTHQEVESLSPPSESGLTYQLMYFDQQKVVEMMFILGLWTRVLGKLATSAYSFYVEVWLPWNHHAVRKPEPDQERDDTEEHGGTRHASEAFSDLLVQSNTVSSWEQPNESSMWCHMEQKNHPAKHCSNYIILRNKSLLC